MSDNSLVALSKARIEALCAAARVAMGLNDTAVFQSTVEQLDADSMDIALPSEVRDLASADHDELAIAEIDAGNEKLSEIVSGLDGAMEKLENAIELAKAGGRDLTLPAVADTASKTLAALNKLEESVSQAENGLNQAIAAKNPDDVKASLSTLMQNLAALASSLKAESQTSKKEPT